MECESRCSVRYEFTRWTFFQGSYFINISYKIVFFILIFQLWVDVIKNFEIYSYNVRSFTGNCFNNSIFVNRETPTIYLTQVLESQNYSVKSNRATGSFQIFMTFTLSLLIYFGQFDVICFRTKFEKPQEISLTHYILCMCVSLRYALKGIKIP